VRSRLEAAKAEADGTYLATHPVADLPEGVKPETAYGEHGAIRIRQGKGWSIGMLEGTAKAHQVVRKDSDIGGLVGKAA